MIAPQDLTICKKSDGSDFLLGQGTFGAVSLSFANLPQIHGKADADSLHDSFGKEWHKSAVKPHFFR